MKSLVSLLSFLILSTTFIAAQDGATTTYPYMYSRFISGTIVFDNGQKEQKELNVHLRNDALHYIDNGVIKEAFLKDLAAVEIGSDVYLPVNLRMMKLVAKNHKACVVAEIVGNFADARESEGAYGVKSSSSATTKLSSIQTDAQVNQNYMNILSEKENGVSLPVETNYWIVMNGKHIQASRKAIESELSAEECVQFKDFIKKNKIKWKNPQSLLLLADFLEK